MAARKRPGPWLAEGLQPPCPMRYAGEMPRLLIRRGEGMGRDHVLSGGECVCGRDPSTTFPLDDTLVSRRHFRVLYENGAYWVEDLGSTNGTLVGGRRMQRMQLTDGDVIRAGNTEVVFVQKDLFQGGPAKPQAAGGAPAPEPSSGPAPLRRRKRR